MKWSKQGRIFKPEGDSSWWKSHCMAPTAILLNSETIRVFMGGWDTERISRIGFIDVCAKDPSRIIFVSKEPVVVPGIPGTFDDNGVFPGHASILHDSIYLYYTGFQLQDKITFTNFGGLSISKDRTPQREAAEHFERAGHVPVLDRSNTGTCVRSGQSVIFENGIYRTWYSAGSLWAEVGGKKRQTYDVYYTESTDPADFPRSDRLCVARNSEVEHGLGRPQVLRTADGIYRMFYTRRILDMKYSFGYSTSPDGLKWTSHDDAIGISHSENDFDSEMVYFPSVVETNDATFLFYSGNGFGESGLGLATLESWD